MKSCRILVFSLWLLVFGLIMPAILGSVPSVLGTEPFIVKSVYAQGQTNTTIYLPAVEKNLTSGEINKYYSVGSVNLQRSSRGGQEKLYYLFPDHLSSTKAIIDKDKTETSYLSYYPYGNTRIFTGDSALQNALQNLYTGQKQDRETNLYYYHARYYNPTIGHFLSADYASRSNRYSYVGNNPVMNNDPSGLAFDSGGGGGGSSYSLPMILKGNDGYIDESYNSRFFKQILENDMQKYDFLARTLRSQSNNSADDIEKIQELSWYLSTSGEWKYHPSQIGPDSFITLRSEWDSLQLEWNAYLTDSIKLKPKERVKKARQITDRIVQNVQDQKNLLGMGFSPVKQYKSGLFVCHNFADLLSTYIQEYAPNVPVYASGVPTHAFDIVEINNKFYLTDPTPGGSFNSPTLTPLEEVMFKNPSFIWSQLDYNPLVSSPLASRDKFTQAKLRALEFVNRMK